MVANQNNGQERGRVFRRSLFTGFVGGFIWSMLAAILYYFNFTEVSPGAYVLRSWLDGAWTSKWTGELVAMFIVGILSIFVAILYYLIFRKLMSMMVGVSFGIILWSLVFLLITPIFYHIPSIREMSNETIVTTICLYILYGTFVGFSISYDYYDTFMKEGR